MKPMPERDDTAKAQLKVRLREPLRARLEAEAKRNGYSLNSEIVARLEASIRDSELGAIIFGDPQLFGLVDTIARVIRAAELRAGKPWTESPATYFEVVEMIYRLLRAGPALIVTGKYPGGVRDMADIGALQMLENILTKDAERRAEDA
jgi:hypothetical protein